MSSTVETATEIRAFFVDTPTRRSSTFAAASTPGAGPRETASDLAQGVPLAMIQELAP